MKKPSEGRRPRRQRYAPNPYLSAPVTILGRPTCFDCFRPVSQCMCRLVSPFEAHCATLILQHPHERKKYYSTVKMIARAITNLKVMRGIHFDPSALGRALQGQKTYLLYPAADALDCTEVKLDSHCTVIAIDGTWQEARKILYHNEFLRSLPCLTFKCPIESAYRIRMQPKRGCLSTLEALGHLLQLNAAVSGCASRIGAYASLLKGFDRFNEQQRQFWPSGSAEDGAHPTKAELKR